MGILKGENLVLSIGNIVIGFATGCSLSMSADTKEITTSQYKFQSASTQFKEFKAGQKTGTISADYLIESGMNEVSALFDSFTKGTELDIKFGIGNIITPPVDPDIPQGDTGTVEIKTTAKHFKCKGIITSLDLNGSGIEDDATYSVSIQITGAIELKN